MLMPLDRPSRADVVRRLVHGTREQERTRLHTSAGEDDRTHAMAGSPGVPGETVRQTAAGAKDTPWPGEQNPVPGAGTTLYELEKGPPAELPPLQPGDEASTRAQVQTSSRKTPPAPLALKDVPELDPEQDTGKYIDQTKRRPRRSFLWILPVALLAAGAFLVFYGGPGGQGLLKKAAIPVSDAHITIAADPGGSVFMDGVPVGSADPSLFFDVKPGLHTLEVRHPRFGPRKFIVELEPGEAKEIVVTFNER